MNNLCLDGMSYDLADGKAILTKGKDVAEVEIPQYVEYEGEKYAVVEIGESAFQDCSNLTSVTFPEGLQSIGELAFSGCSNLSSVTFPEGLHTIGGAAFSGCSNLSSVTFPEGLQTIEGMAFESCDNLSSVTFPEGLQEIELLAFWGCPLSTITTLETQNIDILQEVIGENMCFLSVPKSCQSDYEEEYPNAKIIILGDLHSAEIDGMSYDLADGKAILRKGKDVAEVEIPQYVEYEEKKYAVKTIGKNAFENCSDLSSVTFPEGLQVIGDGAFKECSELSSVTFPEGLQTIEMSAFGWCSNLSSVTFPVGLQTIEEGAFDSCPLSTITTLETQNIDILQEVIGENMCFLSVPKSCQSDYEEEYPNAKIIILGDLHSAEIDGMSYDLADGKAILTKGKDVAEVEIPQYVESEGEKYAVKAIGKNAFENCSDLSSVTFPDGLQTIGDYAFCDCTNLSSITFPEGLQTIGDYAFYKCSNLSSVTFPDGLQEIGDSAFSSCTNLPSVTFPEGLQEIGAGAFEECTNLSSITFPDGLQTIGDSAFYQCSNLSSVTFPEGLQEIHRNTFGRCFNLSSITSYIEDPEVIKRWCSSSRTLYVPSHLKEAYENSPSYSKWKSIEIIE